LGKSKKNGSAKKNVAAETKNQEARGELVSNRAAQDLRSALATPADLIRRLRGEIDRLFEDVGLGNLARGWSDLETSALGGWSPPVELFERGGNLVVRAELPGLKRDEIKVELTDDSVIIEGERKQEHEEKNEGYYRSERRYGQFFRSVPLPDGINPATAKASFRDGVLEISLEAPEQIKRRRHKVEIVEGSARAKAAGR